MEAAEREMKANCVNDARIAKDGGTPHHAHARSNMVWSNLIYLFLLEAPNRTRQLREIYAYACMMPRTNTVHVRPCCKAASRTRHPEHPESGLSVHIRQLETLEIRSLWSLNPSA